MNSIEIGNAKMPSVISNPFGKQKITSIEVKYEPDIFDKKKWKARGRVWFENGDTTGSQTFKGDTFDDVVLQIKAMIENL